MQLEQLPKPLEQLPVQLEQLPVQLEQLPVHCAAGAATSAEGTATCAAGAATCAARAATRLESEFCPRSCCHDNLTEWGLIHPLPAGIPMSHTHTRAQNQLTAHTLYKISSE